MAKLLSPDLEHEFCVVTRYEMNTGSRGGTLVVQTSAEEAMGLMNVGDVIFLRDAGAPIRGHVSRVHTANGVGVVDILLYGAGA